MRLQAWVLGFWKHVFWVWSILESLGFGFSLLDDKVFNGRLGDQSRVLMDFMCWKVQRKLACFSDPRSQNVMSEVRFQNFPTSNLCFLFNLLYFSLILIYFGFLTNRQLVLHQLQFNLLYFSLILICFGFLTNFLIVHCFDSGNRKVAYFFCQNFLFKTKVQTIIKK